MGMGGTLPLRRIVSALRGGLQEKCLYFVWALWVLRSLGDWVNRVAGDRVLGTGGGIGGIFFTVGTWGVGMRDGVIF